MIARQGRAHPSIIDDRRARLPDSSPSRMAMFNAAAWPGQLHPASRILEVHHKVASGLVTHAAVGCAVAPRIRTRRLACPTQGSTA
jgi:hypothetical protein